jgi:small-conductance mechanosensitive channel
METLKASPALLAKREPEIFNNTLTSLSTQLIVYFWCKDVRKREEARSRIYQTIFDHLQSKEIHIK